MFLVVKWSRQKDKRSLSSPAVLLVPHHCWTGNPQILTRAVSSTLTLHSHLAGGQFILTTGMSEGTCPWDTQVTSVGSGSPLENAFFCDHPPKGAAQSSGGRA